MTTPKMIKLTNASKLFKGKTLLINPTHIVSVFEAELEGNPVTMVYSHTRETWEVEQTVDEVYNLIATL